MKRIIADNPVPEGEVIDGREVIKSEAKYIGPQETTEMSPLPLTGKFVSCVELGGDQ